MYIDPLCIERMKLVYKDGSVEDCCWTTQGRETLCLECHVRCMVSWKGRSTGYVETGRTMGRRIDTENDKKDDGFARRQGGNGEEVEEKRKGLVGRTSEING